MGDIQCLPVTRYTAEPAARRRRLWVGIDCDVRGLDGFLPETTVYLLLTGRAPLKAGRDAVPARLPTRLRSVVNSDGEGRRR